MAAQRRKNSTADWSYEDVKAHAPRIVERLRAGTMPCDGAWATEQVDAFQRWIDGGMTA